MDFKKIIIGFIVLLVVIWIYRYFFMDPTASALLDYGDGKDTVVVNSTKLTGNSSATDFTYSLWMYVNNWNYKLGKKKTIIRRLGNGGGLSPEIYLDNYTNDLVVNLEIYKNGQTGDSGMSENMVVSKITNIPLQKWTNITITTKNICNKSAIIKNKPCEKILAIVSISLTVLVTNLPIGFFLK